MYDLIHPQNRAVRYVLLYSPESTERLGNELPVTQQVDVSVVLRHAKSDFKTSIQTTLYLQMVI